ncbi:MAG: transglutaminase-like domain-containing protein [Verrucomicrobiota bacterium]|jgi:regulator of sirC expression with transglutaminase-like and TPR domain
MNSPAAKPSGKLDENQRKALISLLADEDLAVYRTVRQNLLSQGPIAAQWLRQHTLSNDPLLRRRAQEITDHFSRINADTDLLAFCLNQGEDFDLEQGVLLLARTQYPNINIEAYAALLDDLAGELRQRLDFSAEPELILHTISEYLFAELKFLGDETNFYDPDNSYLNRVLDRRKGNPISLSVVFLFLARRLRLPVVGIGLPGHFVCRYQSSRHEIYIDPFRRGRLLSKSDCVKYVMQLRHRFDESCLAPVSARRILLRICANLHQIYTHLKSLDKSERLQRYLVALAK